MKAEKIFSYEGALHLVSSVLMLSPGLAQLFVLPQFQRQGIASRLLEFGLAIADELNIMVCVEATPVGKPLYEKYGFGEVGHFDINLSEYHPGSIDQFRESIMIRAVSKQIGA